MKKKICVYLSIVCLLLCCGKMTALAAATQEPFYCPYCATQLNTTGQNVGNWSEVHYVETGLYDFDMRPITAKCTITHVIDKITKYCPNCNGYSWSENEEREFHSSKYCPYN